MTRRARSRSAARRGPKCSVSTRSIGWWPRSRTSTWQDREAASPKALSACKPQASDMCGIAGRFNYDPHRPIDRDLMVAMTDAVAHRGPDAAGYYEGPGIALGHRRLSIIDLTTGDQPLANEDGSVQVIFNGEIYYFD